MDISKFISRITGQKLLILLYTVVLLAGIVHSYSKSDEYVEVFSMPVSGKTVIIDAGHGGWDPGKVAGDSVLEKEINTSIALKLQQYLEQGDCTVLMTRVDDTALGDNKRTDLAGRKNIVNSENGDMLVSVHQNSFPQKSVSGPQVFFYDGSEESKKLAESIQAQLNEFLNSNKKRLAKSNDSYYMLKQTEIPAVIVECGFLSNDNERQMLTDEKYQQKVAWAVYMGIVNYVNATVSQ